ncbi:hypothetical protein O6H91_16G041000 [Diphasiastrum complanatum]|uniref:Uncharacterized protein n=1 Tax=Diphasiastrum complanatum TaxID=34168 RepID=A0ACC2BBS7_DIPCM|nr:hypothetical protein O6H91_16G041000 [Diphasiastrum complanatum]
MPGNSCAARVPVCEYSKSKKGVSSITRDHALCCVLCLLAFVLAFVFAGAVAERYVWDGGRWLFAFAGGLAVIALAIAVAVDWTEKLCVQT